MRTPRMSMAIGGAAAALVLAGCLPGDTRPPPAVVHLTVEPSAADTAGFTTTDGWQISFDRLLVSLGGARLGARGIGGRDADDSACNSYAGAGYERLFDFTVPGTQKLSDIYGLGSCGVRLRLRSPGSDALLGQGVTADELAQMQVEDTDAVITKGRPSAHVRGKATRNAVTKRFDWTFRLGVSLHGCISADGASFASDVFLVGNEAFPLAVVVHGEELFREGPDDSSPLRFEAIAAADADGDQMITLDELGAVPGPMLDADAGLMTADGGAPTLLQLIYEDLVLRMIRIRDSGPCVGDPPQMPR
ncbi:MAG: hypothetical protein ABJE95_21710 [Byssovorax sp.]